MEQESGYSQAFILPPDACPPVYGFAGVEITRIQQPDDPVRAGYD
ncbi:hypothetical protein ASZ90_009670 [hydrocarbon metagenome]|uniref:Uncharacterized protein n=1 Tax=hydrocarbon metagenome TaxID=938273 RepID=A0A0W8FIQ5_9ZZZZ